MSYIYNAAVALYFLGYCANFVTAATGLWLIFGTDIDFSKGLELGKGIYFPVPSQALIFIAVVIACILAIPLFLVAKRSSSKLRAHYREQLSLFRASKATSMYVAWFFIFLAHAAVLYAVVFLFDGSDIDDALFEHGATLTAATYLYATGILVHEISFRKWHKRQASAA